MKMLYGHSEINQRLSVIASEINALVTTNPDFEDAVCVPILQGSVPFFHDLSKYFCWNPVVDYVGVGSYNGQSQQDLVAYKLPKRNLIEGKCVFLFDDIYDTGRTVDFFVKLLYSLGAKQVIPVVLLKRKTTNVPLDPRVNNFICCFEIWDEWVFGYGMDDDNVKGRTLKHILYNEPDNQAKV